MFVSPGAFYIRFHPNSPCPLAVVSRGILSIISQVESGGGGGSRGRLMNEGSSFEIVVWLILKSVMLLSYPFLHLFKRELRQIKLKNFG